MSDCPTSVCWSAWYRSPTRSATCCCWRWRSGSGGPGGTAPSPPGCSPSACWPSWPSTPSTVSACSTAHGRSAGPIDAVWMLCYVALGLAALHPSMVSLSEPTPPSTRLTRTRLALLAGASLMAPAMLVIQAVREEPIDVAVIAGGSVVLFLLTLARMGGLASEVAMQTERKRAIQTVLRATEQERVRLAADLHDGPGAGADRAPLRPHPGPQPHPAWPARAGRGPAGRARGRAGRRHHRPAPAHGRAAPGRARRAGP